MEEYEEKMCSDCKEKCKLYFRAINDGNIPFGCSKPIESEVKKNDRKQRRSDKP